MNILRELLNALAALIPKYRQLKEKAADLLRQLGLKDARIAELEALLPDEPFLTEAAAAIAEANAILAEEV
jgi:hypothetical protein